MKQPPKGPQWLDIDLRPYAGHYIALVEGRVAAVADTPEGAFARARDARLRRMPVILKISDFPDFQGHADLESLTPLQDG